MRFEKVLVIIEVQLKREMLQQNLPCSAAVIGQSLAEYADDYARANKTGYYPAIEFFKTRDDIDPELIASAEQVAWLVAKLARQTIQRRLRPIFSSVQFRSVQTLAFTMPRVRPFKPDSVEMLAKHYTPDTVKVELELSMMRRDRESDDGQAEPYARKMMFRWLESEFESVQIAESRAI